MTRPVEQKLEPYLKKIAAAEDLETAKTEARLALTLIERESPKAGKSGSARK